MIVHVSLNVINIQSCDNIMMRRAETMFSRWNLYAFGRRGNDQAPIPVVPRAETRLRKTTTA